MTTINPEKLAHLDDINLDHGSHESFEKGHCAMEVVAWLADLGHTDAPSCASPVLTRFTITFNDRSNDVQRQALKPFLPRMVGTADDGKDALREQMAAKAVAELVGPWLRLAGLDAEAQRLDDVDPSDLPAVRRALYAGRDAAWAIRRNRYDLIRTKVREKLLQNGSADAAAAADADADAAADAVADAAAVAVADADAVAVAAAAVPPGVDRWSFIYNAVRDHFRANPIPVAQSITDLADAQRGAALELLDRMIDPQASR